MNGRFERLRGLGPALALAVLAGAAGVVGSYAAAGFTPSFVVAPIDSYLAAVSPGFVITFAITVLGDLGQRLALGTAIALAVTAFAALSLLGTVAGRELASRTDRPAAGPLAGVLLAALGVALLALLLVPATVPALAAGGGAAAVLAVGEAGRLSSSAGRPEGRRAVLTGLAGTIGVGTLGYLLGEGGARGSTGPSAGSGEAADGSGETEPGSMGAEVEELLGTAGDRSLPVEGIEPLVSERFYNVDINSVDPKVPVENWSLRVTGAVEREFDLDYEALTARESREEFVTLRCVGDALNGQKMDNALWTVTDIEPLLEEAGVTADSEQCCVQLHGADDYYVAFPLSALREGMLAYRMNGAPLPPEHGAPVRALVPGHWGEVNAKWITEIEVLDEEVKGYWEQKGWHGTGPVTPVAKLHATNRLDDGRMELGGHAYAGTRGVSTVEVSTDGGDSWTEAALSDPLPGEPKDAWRQWVRRYDPPDGTHVAVVRMYDAEGTVQPRDQSNPFPSGASGWVRETIRP